MLIPYIKAAQKIRPDLKIWGSPWKSAGVDVGGLSWGNAAARAGDAQAYAIYLARFVEEYEREGIDIFAVDFQNEPASIRNIRRVRGWMRRLQDFIRDYAGPTARRKVPAGKFGWGRLRITSWIGSRRFCMIRG